MEEGKLELTWVGKDRRLLAHGDDSYEWVDPADWRVSEIRLLHDVDTVGDPNNGNLLIHGDAMHALDALIHIPHLAARYEGKVKLVYIDPPFNTGQAFTHYEDNLEHSVWLTLLRDRLTQIQRLLAPDGSIWVHLDDTEAHRARCVLDEVFGPENFVATVIWQKAHSRKNDSRLMSTAHDSIVVYGKTRSAVGFNRQAPDESTLSRYANPDNDPRGPWLSVPLQGPNIRPNLTYPVVSPTTGKTHMPPAGNCWRRTREEVERMIANNEIYFGRAGNAVPRIKSFLADASPLIVPWTWWPRDEVGDNQSARAEARLLAGGRNTFDTPKPERLLERVIHIGSNPGDIVLDCFGGSGTAAAVAHKMGRRWVTAEVSADTISTFLRPRLELVVKGEDPGGVTESVGWEGGGGFTHVEVGPSMFEDVDGTIVMAEWAVGGELTEAVAAQLEFELAPEGPLAGRKGRKRLAVVDGMVTGAVVEHLVGLIGDDETLLVVGRALAPGVEDRVRELRSGSRARKIPRDLATVGRLPSRLVRLKPRKAEVVG